MANTNANTITPNARAAVEALKNAPDGLTLSQICEVTGLSIAPGSVGSAVKKGYIEVIGEVEVEKPAKRPVLTYTFVTGDVLTNAEGKPFNYTDSEKEILKVAATIEGPFTLADLAEAMGLEKLSSGRINGLVNKKGNIAKGEKITVPTFTKTTVNVYGFVKDIPADVVVTDVE